MGDTQSHPAQMCHYILTTGLATLVRKCQSWIRPHLVQTPLFRWEQSLGHLSPLLEGKRLGSELGNDLASEQHQLRGILGE